MEREEPLCFRCDRTQRTCCQICQIYVTPGDVERITAYAGQQNFFEYRRPTDPEYLDQDDDPLWAACVFRSDGTRRVLRRTDAQGCIFLGPQGCRLPLEVRPLVCRLYPFEYTERGLTGVVGSMCPHHLLAPGETLLDSLGMDAETAERWRTQLYSEIRREPTAPAPVAGEGSATIVVAADQPHVTPSSQPSLSPNFVAPSPVGGSHASHAAPGGDCRVPGQSSSPCTSV